MIIHNLKNRNFFPEGYSSVHCHNPWIKWDQTCSQSGPTVYSDYYLSHGTSQSEEKKMAWLIEPMAINSRPYNWIRKHHHFFDTVFTHSMDLISSMPNGRWVPAGGAWIAPQDRSIYPKKHLCSFIASNKNFAPGHKLRQQVRRTLPSWVVSYGGGHKKLDEKVDGLRDYHFSIAIENSVADAYFTEKVIDCFLTGTVPIYWGTHWIEEFFDPAGILRFNTMTDLHTILNDLDESLYHRMKAAITSNFERAKLFDTGENWMLGEFLERLPNNLKTPYSKIQNSAPTL